MSDVLKTLARGFAQTTVDSPTTIYTPPGKLATIIKSLVLCNASTASVEFIITIGGVYFMRYTMRANETIVVPVVDQLLLGSSYPVRIGASVSNAITYHLAGVEFDRGDSLNPYYNVWTMYRGTVENSSRTIGNSSGRKRIIKSFVVCNTSPNPVAVRVSIGSFPILWDYTLKGYETLVVPTMDLLIDTSTAVTAINSSTYTSIAFHITVLEVY